jgi:hypothetical protein
MKAQRFLIWVIVVVVAINLGLVVVVILGSGPAPAKPLPNPNGYDDFVRAARAISGPLFDATNEVQWRALVASNAEPLRLIREGLERESCVSVEGTQAFLTGQMTYYLPGLKKLATMMRDEGRIAEIEGRTNDAALIYLDVIRFGEHAARGGLLITSLVGIACENIGNTDLRRVANSLDAQTSREIADGIARLDQQRELPRTVTARDRAWATKAYGWQGRIYALEVLVRPSLIQASLDKYVQKVENVEKQNRTVMLILASHAYTLDHGAPPSAAADLVPTYLKAVPIDPVTGTNMVLLP